MLPSFWKPDRSNRVYSMLKLIVDKCLLIFGVPYIHFEKAIRLPNFFNYSQLPLMQ